MRIRFADNPDGTRELRAAESEVGRITPALYIGAAPRSPADAAQLQHDLGIAAVLSLQTDRDLETAGLTWPEVERWFHALGIETLRVPIEDFSPEALLSVMPDAVETLRRLLDAGRVVYMHCTAGVSRSPTIALAYLHLARGEPLQQAFDAVMQRRPQADPYDEVIEALRAGRRPPPRTGS